MDQKCVNKQSFFSKVNRVPKELTALGDSSTNVHETVPSTSGLQHLLGFEVEFCAKILSFFSKKLIIAVLLSEHALILHDAKRQYQCHRTTLNRTLRI